MTVCFITTQLKWQCEFDISIQPSDLNGLKKTSLIRLNKFVTIDKDLIIGRLGVLDDNYFNLSFKLGLGLTYVVSERINLELVPSFDYLILNHFNDDTNDSMRFWDIGGMIVIKHKF